MTMREVLQQRLAKLREDYESGVQAMNEIQQRQDDLRATLLRISGAIQVLEELLQDTPSPPTQDQ